LDKTSVMAYFCMYGDEFPLSKVSEILKIGPTKSYSKGDAVVRPDNGNLVSTVTNYRKETAWEYSTGYQESVDISIQLDMLLEVLENKVSELKGLHEEYKVTYKFMIVIRIENNEKPAMYLDQRFINFAHAIKADVDFDLYIFS